MPVWHSSIMLESPASGGNVEPICVTWASLDSASGTMWVLPDLWRISSSNWERYWEARIRRKFSLSVDELLSLVCQGMAGVAA